LRQLRLVGLAEDGDSLVLESPTGESYRLPVDDRVRAACRGDLTRLGQIEIEMDNPLRPREIQMRVRTGESAEQVAASSGMPLDRVLRFASPVLQERSRVVSQARTMPARPRAAEALGDLVEERLVSRGTDAATLQWDAWRRDDGRWAVRLAWRHGDTAHAAHWSLDLGRRVLQAEDPAAEQLCAEEFHARTITAVTPLAVAARAADGPRRRVGQLADSPAGPDRQTDAGRGAPDRRGAGQVPPRRTDAQRADGDAGARDAGPDPRRSALAQGRAGDSRSSGSAPATGGGAAPAGAADPGTRPGPDRTTTATSSHDRRPTSGRDERTPGVRDRGTPAASGRATPAAGGRATSGAGGRDGRASGGRGASDTGGRDGRTSGGRGASAANARNERAGQADEGADPGDAEPPVEAGRIAAGGGTVPLVEPGEGDDRARRATVPSWDDILLGVRRRH
jgi:hypothetical protein